MKIKNIDVVMIAESAYRHGIGYKNSNIYRHAGRWCFKNPEALGLPDWVTQVEFSEHKFLANVYRHSFRAGLNSK